MIISFCANAQDTAQTKITLQVKNAKLFVVLQEMEKQAGIYFSYDGRLINRDSLVTINLTNQPLNTALQAVFSSRFEYQQQGRYLVIAPAMPRLAFTNTDVVTDGNLVSVSGLVTDEHSGERLMYASVYDKDQLVATLTDEHGYFKLRLRPGASGSIAVTAGKRLYHDTTVHFLQSVLVNARAGTAAYLTDKSRGNRVERTGLGQAFISTRQMIQSINIPNFFASRPFQVSITPGLSTHGMFSPQVVNRFSLNLIGGYTAGVNGIEAGGLFNINKRDSRYLQLAGVFNLVGGNAYGLQLAGVHNRALDTVKGVQLSFFTNQAEQQLSGLQISAMHNRTRYLKGVQVGIVNVADTSEGMSIGLVNIVRNGFYKLSYSASNLANTNLALKTGTHGFYSSLLVAANPSVHQKFYSFGMGIGHDFMFTQRIYLSAEADYQFAYTGLWDDRWTQGKLLLNYQLTKSISVFGGTTFNKYSYTGSQPGYQSRFELIRDYKYYLYRRLGNPVQHWTGWELGIAFNSVFKPAVKKITDVSKTWYIGAAATAGIGWNQPFRLVKGADLFLQRDLGENLSAILTTGYTYFSAPPVPYVYQSNDFAIYEKPMRIVPLRAGVRLKTGKTFYISGEVGQAFGNARQGIAFFNTINANTGNRYSNPYLRPYRAWSYAASAGFSFSNGLEAGFKFDDYGLQTEFKQFALRLGYRLKLNK
ncbi:STN and carboxypeptidase regulatory-like domain-containing protein [Mucilaginibacter sp. CSA2-8R]|uniref:STN and carboxypeptidase regulatory-like domain-containing protein n=1 Tax=Mucilaginibacter sp. CSA2-8R TaxID=3141542 RepID=UPI00315D5EA3